MIQTISEPVSVILTCPGPSRSDLVGPRPLSLTWQNRDYIVTKQGLHHTYRSGRTLHHIYSVLAGDLFFRLNLNTDTLRWTLEEVSDGLPD
jgi:hypothetical protein